MGGVVPILRGWCGDDNDVSYCVFELDNGS